MYCDIDFRPCLNFWDHYNPLKPTVAADRLGVPVLGVAGVTLWAHALPVLETLAPSTVVLALDQDADSGTATAVAAARSACATALQAAGYTVVLAAWPARFKGLDDALIGGAVPSLATLC